MKLLHLCHPDHHAKSIGGFHPPSPPAIQKEKSFDSHVLWHPGLYHYGLHYSSCQNFINTPRSYIDKVPTNKSCYAGENEHTKER